MREQADSTLSAPALANQSGEFVQVYVDHRHPLLQLKEALPWEAIEALMVAAWRKAGKNVAGLRGRPWPVSLYVPLLVLMLVKRLDSREMEAYLAENAVARVFIGQQVQLQAQLRDHASIARALAALGAQGVEEVNKLILVQATQLGFADESVLSGDTTCQELPIGYPHEAGIIKGITQRCARALVRLKKQGVATADAATLQVREVMRSVRHYHLFAKGKEEKDQLLRQMLQTSERLMEQTSTVVAQLGERGERVVKAAVAKLNTMKQVTETLLPQSVGPLGPR